MPSKSDTQRRLFGMALAVKRGQLRTADAKITRLAKELSEKQLVDFAKRKEEEKND